MQRIKEQNDFAKSLLLIAFSCTLRLLKDSFLCTYDFREIATVLKLQKKKSDESAALRMKLTADTYLMIIFLFTYIETFLNWLFIYIIAVMKKDITEKSDVCS